MSVGTIGEATEKDIVRSLPVTPCMELPGSPSMSAILYVLDRKKDGRGNENVYGFVFIVLEMAQRSVPYLYWNRR